MSDTILILHTIPKNRLNHIYQLIQNARPDQELDIKMAYGSVPEISYQVEALMITSGCTFLIEFCKKLSHRESIPILEYDQSSYDTSSGIFWAFGPMMESTKKTIMTRKHSRSPCRIQRCNSFSSLSHRSLTDSIHSEPDPNLSKGYVRKSTLKPVWSSNREPISKRRAKPFGGSRGSSPLSPPPSHYRSQLANSSYNNDNDKLSSNDSYRSLPPFRTKRSDPCDDKSFETYIIPPRDEWNSYQMSPHKPSARTLSIVGIYTDHHTDNNYDQLAETLARTITLTARGPLGSQDDPLFYRVCIEAIIVNHLNSMETRLDLIFTAVEHCYVAFLVLPCWIIQLPLENPFFIPQPDKNIALEVIRKLTAECCIEITEKQMYTLLMDSDQDFPPLHIVSIKKKKEHENKYNFEITFRNQRDGLFLITRKPVSFQRSVIRFTCHFQFRSPTSCPNCFRIGHIDRYCTLVSYPNHHRRYLSATSLSMDHCKQEEGEEEGEEEQREKREKTCLTCSLAGFQGSRCWKTKSECITKTRFISSTQKLLDRTIEIGAIGSQGLFNPHYTVRNRRFLGLLNYPSSSFSRSPSSSSRSRSHHS